MHRSLMHRSLLRKPVRALVMSGAVVALAATSLALAGPSIALGQETAECEITDLGTLGSSSDSVLEAEGRWTTEDCDSRFRAGSDAHTFRFQVAEAGRVRIGLSSAEADSYLYLLAEDGSRIADNDDNGGPPRRPRRARPRARHLPGRGHHGRRARPRPGRLHPHGEPG